MPLHVIIDTNFITVPAQFGVDIFAEAERILERNIEFTILSSALEELKRKLSSPTSKIEERHFRIARDLVERCVVKDLEDIPPAESVDDQILFYAKSIGGILATNDKVLRRKAKDIGVPVLYLRGQDHLVLDGSII